MISLAWSFFRLALSSLAPRPVRARLPIPIIFLIAFFAIIPGHMNAFVFVSLLLDKRPSILDGQKSPDITILISAFNEEAFIGSTLEGIARQKYPS